MRAPIFILGCHKSGTTLVRNLLDGHPALYVLPREAHFFQFSGFWVDYALRRASPAPASVESIARRLEHENADGGRYGDAQGAPCYDVGTFVRRYAAPWPAQLGPRFELYIRALIAAMGDDADLDQQRLVEKSVENTEYAGALAHAFPDGHFIHVVRNPYATLVAIRRSRDGKRVPRLHRAARSMHNSYYHLFKNRAYLPNYHVLRYEDLVRSPEQVMRDLAERLGLEFHDTMLSPTSRGTRWEGNSTSDAPLQGIDPRPLDAWRDHITPIEVHLVNRLAAPVLEAYDYPQLTPGRPAWWPARGEQPGAYVPNRLLLRSFRLG